MYATCFLSGIRNRISQKQSLLHLRDIVLDLPNQKYSLLIDSWHKTYPIDIWKEGYTWERWRHLQYKWTNIADGNVGQPQIFLSLDKEKQDIRELWKLLFRNKRNKEDTFDFRSLLFKFSTIFAWITPSEGQWKGLWDTWNKCTCDILWCVFYTLAKKNFFKKHLFIGD